MSDYLMDTYKRTGLVFESGTGSTLVSVDGKRYVDFTSGIGVNALGHANPAIIKAITEQSSRMIHVSNYYMSVASLECAEKICGVTGMDRAFFCNSGAEANEGAVKIARRYGWNRDPSKNVVVTLNGSFHGRTIAMLAATAQEKFRKGFGPFPEGFRHVTPGNIAELEAALTPDVCAFMFEPIQGESGVCPLDRGYLKEAARLCAERDILLVADEVQCGVGRSGTFLACEQYGVKPDIVTLAKGLAGGVPVGVVLARGEAATTLGKGDHGTTFGGNPLASNVALAVLGEIGKPGFLRDVAAKGRKIMDTVSSWNHPEVKAVRGMGLMIGVAVRCKPDAVKMAAIDLGLLVLTAGEDVVRFLPPLVITDEEIDKGLDLFRKALDKARSEG